MQEIDKPFRKGQWRSIYPFLHLEENGNTRTFRGWQSAGVKTNALLSMRVYTIGVDVIPAIADMLTCVDLRNTSISSFEHPCWNGWISTWALMIFQMHSVDGSPFIASEQRAAVVAVWSPQVHGWRYGVINGCLHGIGSVVLTFNRYLPS